MRNRKQHAIYMSLAVLLSPAIWQAQDRIEPTFSLSIHEEAASPEFARGTHRISVVYTNTSGLPQKDGCAISPVAYRMTVWRDGVLLEKRPTKPYQTQPKPNSGQPRVHVRWTEQDFCQGINEPISPGKSVTFPLWLSADYDTTVPGTYVIMVTRETDPWNPDKSVAVKSNSITIVVPEPEVSPSK